jgi:hypothetical protein
VQRISAAIALGILLAFPNGGVFSQDASRPECGAQLRKFVAELDDVLSSDPHPLYTLFALLKRFFPIEKCDIEAAISVCRQSKFFLSADIGQRVTVIIFNSGANGRRSESGYEVSFGISNETGNTQFPSARPNKMSL